MGTWNSVGVVKIGKGAEQCFVYLVRSFMYGGRLLVVLASGDCNPRDVCSVFLVRSFMYGVRFLVVIACGDCNLKEVCSGSTVGVVL